MSAARVTSLRDPLNDHVATPLVPTVVIGCRWSPKSRVIHDRVDGLYSELNPEPTQDGARLQRALLAKPAATWWSRLMGTK